MAVTDPKPEAHPTSSPSPTGRAPLASESSDARVHQLLADRQAHVMNRDLLDPPPPDPAALRVIDDQIADVDAELAELGFSQDKPLTGKQRGAEEKKLRDAEAAKLAKRAEARQKRADAADKAAADEAKR